MDYSNRNVQPQAAAPGAQTTAAGNFSPSVKKGKRGRNRTEVSRIVTVVLVAAVAILIGAVIALTVSGGNSIKPESKYVDTNKLQAVFLNTGQVYFGHITNLNNKYFVVTNIYYLQTANGSSTSGSTTSSTANNSVSLVKLGCELHEPYDQMVINRDQVTFWENLQDNGQVAKAVATFQKQNPTGQKCTDQSSSASSTSTNSTQSAGSTTTPSTTTTKP
jgi:hypothetical protein